MKCNDSKGTSDVDHMDDKRRGVEALSSLVLVLEDAIRNPKTGGRIALDIPVGDNDEDNTQPLLKQFWLIAHGILERGSMSY